MMSPPIATLLNQLVRLGPSKTHIQGKRLSTAPHGSASHLLFNLLNRTPWTSRNQINFSPLSVLTIYIRGYLEISKRLKLFPYLELEGECWQTLPTQGTRMTTWWWRNCLEREPQHRHWVVRALWGVKIAQQIEGIRSTGTRMLWDLQAPHWILDPGGRAISQHLLAIFLYIGRPGNPLVLVHFPWASRNRPCGGGGILTPFRD